ncbi:11022_t:CDS:2, partial [Gigaspora rosea]
MTNKILDVLRRIWSSPKWRSYVNTKNPVINESTYVCEILALFLNTVMDDLPVNYDTWLEWGDKASYASAEQKGSYKSA